MTSLVAPHAPVTRLPDINTKPRPSSLPASPSNTFRPPRHHQPDSRPGSQLLAVRQNVSLNGAVSSPAFIAGATVAGPLTASHIRASVTNTAVTAAALFAISAGQTLTAAGIAYTATGNGTIAPPGIGPAAAAAAAAALAAGSSGSGGRGGTPASTVAAAAPPPPGSATATAVGSLGSLPLPPSVRGASNGGDGAGMVSLEDEFGGAASGGGGGGGGSASAAALLPSETKLIEDERLRNRLVSLPNIVCRSANGDVFLVDLGSGGEDAAATAASGGALNRAASIAPGRNRNGAAAVAAVTALQRGAIGAVTMVERDPLMEAELERHLAATDEIVQQRRQQLEDEWRRRRIVAANPAAAAKEMEEARRTAAIEFAVQQFVPRRLALMALNMPPVEGGDGGAGGDGTERGAVEHGDGEGGGGSGATGAHSAGVTPKTSLSGEAPQLSTPPPRHFGADFKVPIQNLHWKQLQAGIERLYDRMPFLTNWVSTIRKLHRDETGGGWDGLIHGVDELYVKGREEHQGTNIYVLKCHELGVTPSTQVIQQLSSSEANMSHCHLGRQGAAALRHALSANVTITHLNLQDNHLDATGLESILAGLYSGTMAKQPRARKLLEKRIQTAANTLGAAVNGNGGGGGGGAAPPGSPSAAGGGGGGGPSATAAAATAALRLSAPFASPPRRSIPGDLKEQEQRRLAEEDMQRQEEEARRARGEAARTASALDSVGDAPEWLRLITQATASNVNRGRGGNKPKSGGAGGMGGIGGGNVPGQSVTPGRLTCAITSLDLSNNPLGINGVRALADLLDPTITPYQ
ncbi:hypothetical protein VOLCADRAFT_96736, partial [Volvox carteri f. nagariensis]